MCVWRESARRSLLPCTPQHLLVTVRCPHPRAGGAHAAGARAEPRAPDQRRGGVDAPLFRCAPALCRVHALWNPTRIAPPASCAIGCEEHTHKVHSLRFVSNQLHPCVCLRLRRRLCRRTPSSCRYPAPVRCHSCAPENRPRARNRPPGAPEARCGGARRGAARGCAPCRGSCEGGGDGGYRCRSGGGCAAAAGGDDDGDGATAMRFSGGQGCARFARRARRFFSGDAGGQCAAGALGVDPRRLRRRQRPQQRVRHQCRFGGLRGAEAHSRRSGRLDRIPSAASGDPAPPSLQRSAQ